MVYSMSFRSGIKGLKDAQRLRMFVYYEPRGLKTRSAFAYSSIMNQGA